MSSLWSSQTGAGSRYGWRGGVGVVRGGGGTMGPVFVPQSTRIAWQLAARQVTSSRQIDECCNERNKQEEIGWKLKDQWMLPSHYVTLSLAVCVCRLDIRLSQQIAPNTLPTRCQLAVAFFQRHSNWTTQSNRAIKCALFRCTSTSTVCTWTRFVPFKPDNLIIITESYNNVKCTKNATKNESK